MLDYRMHYAVMAAEDRLRPARRDVVRADRLPKRVFQLASRQPARGEARR